MTPVKQQVIDLGRDEVTGERVAEAVQRRVAAKESGHAFIYIDVVQELEDLYRSNGATDREIELAKSDVWDAARGISDELGFPIEECLFFCFHEAMDVYGENHPAPAAPLTGNGELS
jgi:hypothetical protein